MSDSTNRVGRRTFLYGAGSIALTSVLAGCSGGSSGDNGSGNGTSTEGGAATEAATDTGSGTELTNGGTDTDTDSATETDAETETDGDTDSDTDTDNDTETDDDTDTGTETAESETDDEDGDDDDGNYQGRDSERLTYGEIRQQPPSTLDDLNQEYVELINASGSAIDLSGYTITYGDGANYTFDDGFELGVGDQVTIHTGSGDDSDTDVYVGRDEVALDYQGPDDVTVKNADGNVVLEATA